MICPQAKQHPFCDGCSHAVEHEHVYNNEAECVGSRCWRGSEAWLHKEGHTQAELEPPWVYEKLEDGTEIKKANPLALKHRSLGILPGPCVEATA